MKGTKTYWYHNTAYSVAPYFVYLHFPNLLSTFGISAELNIHFMNAIHLFEENYQLYNVKYEILYPKSNFRKYHNFRHFFTIIFLT